MTLRNYQVALPSVLSFCFLCQAPHPFATLRMGARVVIIGHVWHNVESYASRIYFGSFIEPHQQPHPFDCAQGAGFKQRKLELGRSAHIITLPRDLHHCVVCDNALVIEQALVGLGGPVREGNHGTRSHARNAKVAAIR